CKLRGLDLVFISHVVEAQVVSEQEFVTVSSSGGTRCSSAYWLALRHIRDYHPAAMWSHYACHFSDGVNLATDNEACCKLPRQRLDVCCMVGYGEIRYGGWGSFYGSGGKQPRRPQSGLHAALARLEHPNLLLVCIDSRDEIYSALRAFLAQEQ